MKQTPPLNFIDWLEGYLDALKNNVSKANVRTIRKKMKESNGTTLKFISLNDSPSADEQLAQELDPEYLAAIAEKADSSTMDELS